MKRMVVRLRKSLTGNDNATGKLLFSGSLFFAILAYVCRAQSDEFRWIGNSLLETEIIHFLFFPLWISLFSWFIIHIILVIRYLIRAESSRFAVIISTLLIALTFILPVPPNKIHALFLSHQDEYNTLVKLAKSGQLSEGVNNNVVCRIKDSYVPPAGYENLTVNCIYVENNARLITFSPYMNYVTLTYMETPQEITDSYHCYGEYGSVYQQIDLHWYICELQNLGGL